MRGGDDVSDYNLYDFTIREADLLRVLKDAAAHGCKPMVIINGMFYNLELDKIPSAPSADPDELF